MGLDQTSISSADLLLAYSSITTAALTLLMIIVIL